MSMRDYKFTLAAGQERSLNVQGNWFHVLDAVGTVGIRFDEGVLIERSQGQGGSRSYSRVLVSSPIAQTVILSLGVGQETDARASFTGTVNTTIEPSNTILPKAEVTIAAGATVILAAANANRKELRLGVKSSEANGVYIGNVSVGALTPGGYIEEGSVEYVGTEAAVYGYNAGAVSIEVNVLDLERP